MNLAQRQIQVGLQAKAGIPAPRIAHNLDTTLDTVLGDLQAEPACDACRAAHTDTERRRKGAA